MKNDKIIKEFTNYLTLENLSRNSVKTYINYIVNFSKKVDIENLTQENINEFFLSLNCPVNTVNQYKKTLLQFLKFRKLELQIPKMKQAEQKLPEYFDENYFLNEIIPCVDDIYRDELKIRCLFFLMFYTGLRVGEISRLKKADFDLQNKRIKIQHRKAKNPIIIYYPEEINDLIEVYFTTIPDKESVFNCSEANINYICKRLSDNINKRISPHTFRHSFAVMFLKKGGDISVLKELLGHKSLISTLIYTKMTNEDIENEYRKLIKIDRRPRK